MSAVGPVCPPGEPEGVIYLGQSRGMCRVCRAVVPARYLSQDGKVFLERLCPEHGKARALVAESLAWYLDAMRSPGACTPPPRVLPDRTHGCPGACGPCLFHGQRCHLPVIQITDACNLRCPICFGVNRSEEVRFMSPGEFQRHIDFLVQATGGVDLINITGGEPTLHPELPRLLEIARRTEIGRITLNTNGIVLARRPELARTLAELGVYVVLSLDTLDPALSVRLHGMDMVDDKRRALDNLEAHGVQTTLLHVLVADENEREMSTWLDMLLSRPFIRSLTIQTMTYTGQGGRSFLPRKHLPVDAVEGLIETASAGRVRRTDFMPLPTSHPLCYGVCYLVAGERAGIHPMARLLDRETLADMAKDGYLLHPSAESERRMKLAIDRLWSEGQEPELLLALKGMLRSVYPSGETLTVHERQRRAERHVKTIYVHAHMDEDTFEVGRAMRCPDQVVVDGARLIGACNYNLIYREGAGS